MGRLKVFAAGLVAGILVAPRAGSESRRIVMEWLNDALDKGVDGIGTIEDELRGRADRFRRGGPEPVVDAGEPDIDDVGGEAEDEPAA